MTEFEKDRIHVVVRDGFYHARFLGPHADFIVELFGTDTLQTPFTDRCPVIEVLKALRDRNPGARVYL